MRNKCKHKNTVILSITVMFGNTVKWCTDCGATKLSSWNNTLEAEPQRLYGKWKSPKNTKTTDIK